MPEAQLVFLAPPCWEELVRRLAGRGTEPPEVIERRLAAAQVELAAEQEFDVTLVNTSVEPVRGRTGSLARRASDLDHCPMRAGATVHVGRSSRVRIAPLPRASPTRRSTSCSRPPTPSTAWSSTAPSARGRSTPTTRSSARACWSTSARWSTPHVQEKPLSIALREINDGLLTAEAIDAPSGGRQAVSAGAEGPSDPPVRRAFRMRRRSSSCGAGPCCRTL